MKIPHINETTIPAADPQPGTPRAAKEVLAAGIAVWPVGTSVAWGVKTNDDTELSGVIRARDERAGYLEAFERVVELAKEPGTVRVELFCSDRVFLEAVGPLASSWLALIIHPWSELSERGWLVTGARTLARQAGSPASERVASVEAVDDSAPLLAATDGSKGAKGVSGFGWVTAEGEFGFGGFSGSILLTELAAVGALLKGTPRRRPLTVLMDSRDAIDVLHGLRRGEAVTAQRVPGTYGSWCLLRRIQHAMRNREVTFEWVRGHSGHPLNECADRIALQARRHLDSGTAPDVLDTVMSRIIADFRSATTRDHCPARSPLAAVA
jgi:ribonuclease HI